MTFRSEADSARERVLSRRAKDLKKYHPGHRNISRVESQLKEAKAKNQARAERIENAKKKTSASREATPPKTSIQQELSDRQFREQESRQVKTWNPKEQMADRYAREHPDMPVKEHFVPVRDSKGKIVGYTDTLSKKSVMLKKDESITEKSLRTASKRVSALINIEKDKEPKDPNKYGGEAITGTPKKDFSSSLTTTLLKLEQRSKASSNPLVRIIGSTGAFLGAMAKTAIVDLPILAGVAVKGLVYDIPQSHKSFASLSPGEKRSKTKGASETFVPAIAVGSASFVQSQVSTFQHSPAVFAGNIVGSVIGPTVWSKIIGGVSKGATNILAKVGLKKVSPTDVFSAKTLATGELPKAKSSAEILEALEGTRTSERVTRLVNGKWVDVPGDDLANLPFQTPSYVKITHGTSANLGRTGTFAPGEKGRLGLEDPGTFFTVTGDASPIRFGVETDYSFKPFSWLDDLGSSQQGRLYNLKVKGGSYVPRSVLSTPGFGDDLANFYASTADDQMAYVSKRGMVGKNEITRQFFSATDDFVVPTKSLTVTRDGNLLKLSKGEMVRAGDIIREAGTSESELIKVGRFLFGEGETNVAQKLLKAEGYTSYGGQTILLSEGRSVSSSIVSTPIKESVSSSTRVMSSSDIASESARSVMSASTSTIYVDPVSSGIGLFGSSVGVVAGSSSIVSSASSGVSVSSVYVSPETSFVSPKSEVSSISSSSIVSVYSPSVSSSPASKRSGRSSKSSSSGSSSVSGSVSSPSSVSTPVSITSTSGFSGIGSSIVSSPSSTPGSRPSYYPGGESSIVSTPTSYYSKKSKYSLGNLFSAEVRKRGRWVTVDPGFGYSESEALHKGLFSAGHSASASVRVVKAKPGSKKKRFYGRGIFSDFYSKGNVFIEKRGRRIKSRGELEEITFKGQRARKNTPLKKSIMGKMRMWGK